MQWSTKSVIDTWKSDDGKVTIWTISNGETEKKTMSAVISKIGWSGEIEEYQNAKGNSYIRQPAKEGFGNTFITPPTGQVSPVTSSGGTDSNLTPENFQKQLDRIEKKLDWIKIQVSDKEKENTERAIAQHEAELDQAEFKPEDIPVDEEKPF